MGSPNKTIASRRRSCTRSAPRIEKRDAKGRSDLRDGRRAGHRVATRVAAARADFRERAAREVVIPDVGALLNTTNLDSARICRRRPEVRKSILNFGFPDLVAGARSTRTASSTSRAEIEIGAARFRAEARARLDQGPPGRDRRRRTNSRCGFSSAPTALASGRRSGAIRRRGGARLRQDQDRSAVSDEPGIPEVLQSGALDPARAGGRIRGGLSGRRRAARAA